VGRGTVGAHVDRRKSPDRTGRANGDRGKLCDYTREQAVLAYRWAIGGGSKKGAARVRRRAGPVVQSVRNTHTLLGERIAESVALATDPANLIWVMPAKGSNGELHSPRRLLTAFARPG
jgi:hypothetical protein